VFKTTREPVEIPKLEEKGQATAYRMTRGQFDITDATLAEYRLIPADQKTAVNTRKLMIAVERLNQVILLRWNDTETQRIGLMVLSSGRRLILKEIAPANIAEFEEAVKIAENDVSEKELAEAKRLVEMLPEATEEHLNVDDYRVKLIGARVKPAKKRVQELEEILATVTA